MSPRAFDEVMIVNPEGPDMNYGYYAPWGYGYAAGPDDGYGYYGYYAQPPAGQWDGYGWYGDGYGDYDDADELGDYGEDDEFGDDGDLGDELDYGPYEPLEPGYGYDDDLDYAGYAPDLPPGFNAGCPMPTNVAGYPVDTLDGYVAPGDVSPTCTGFTSVRRPTVEVPDTFRPLW